MKPSIRSVFTAFFLLLAGCSTHGNSFVTVTPDLDGKVGTIHVYPEGGGSPIALDKPYGSVKVDTYGRATPVQLTKEESDRQFSTTLAALPTRPSRFTLYCQEGSDQLTSESQAIAGTILKDIASRPAAEVVVIGHTDTVGSGPDNDQLSLQRAKMIKMDLVKHGLAPDKILVSGRGKRELLVPTDDNVNEPRNRRIEINVR